MFSKVIISNTNAKLAHRKTFDQDRVYENVIVDDLGKIDEDPRQPKLEVRFVNYNY